MLILAIVVLGLAYWVGITAEGPDWSESDPVEVEAPAEPAAQPE